jgi:hypothetical protein
MTFSMSCRGANLDDGERPHAYIRSARLGEDTSKIIFRGRLTVQPGIECPTEGHIAFTLP